MTRIPASIRRMVQARADHRCEYCGISERVRPHPFQVEHIRSLKQGGSSEPENLAWACLHCNLRKGTDIAAYDDLTGDLVPLFNPRTQHWDAPFSLIDNLIIGITPIGQATADLLQFNHPRQIESRAVLIQSGLW